MDDNNNSQPEETISINLTKKEAEWLEGILDYIDNDTDDTGFKKWTEPNSNYEVGLSIFRKVKKELNK